MTFQQSHWYLKDLQYEYLDDGFKLTATTDVPCHLWARMTTTPPRKHALPTYRRGLYMQGDIRFCFVVYEDNEQIEAGDTLIHTWLKSAWPVCETRWFYFVGTIVGLPTVSESPIFTFHFPAPPPDPPPPIERLFIAQSNNRVIRSNANDWGSCWGGNLLTVMNVFGINPFVLHSGARLSVSFFAYRAFLAFDTSVIPDTARIMSASLELYVWLAARTSSAAYPFWQATKGHQSDPIVIGDWAAQNPESAVLGQIDYSNLISSQYNIMPLNALGLSHINLSGLTKFCLRSQLDVENRPPPLGTNWSVFHSEQKDDGFWPLLKVQYYPA